ncbi:TonB-dependent receptor [Pseudobacter ginsenosidimutans]|uniref:Iron complex outermembrane receptor protein n=1 Tax=Pseudobacter ginsenosidimutans TaxID=661488 RepID=A0A4Q7MBP1_9BACT|nr:TonB-dependent receptor [Pseudobacter ginsenosidimutans]RZS65201.1 iron complex outermembrane receptor protein [Pseudobacter ginsenosidimutans]
MQKLFLGICYLLCSQWLTAQQISGKVTDLNSGAAVASATVELSNIATTTTNASGDFIFRKIRSGDYRIRISSIGYKAVDTTVAAGSNLEFKLQRLNLFMQPVEVRAIQAGDKSPFTKTNLSKKEIEKLNLGQDIPFVLNQTPSAVVSSDAGTGIGYTGIRIRGTDATRINVTLNGIPYNDAESQGTFFVNLPDFTSSVNNIQVQRGVGTSSNGGTAFGATINLSTNEVNTQAYGELNNSAGSFNTWKHTVKAGTGLINNHWTVDARLSKVSSDGYVERASSDLRAFYISGAYIAEKTSVRLNVFSGKEKTYQSWYGVSDEDLKTNRRINYAGMEKPGAPYDNQTDNFQQDHYQLFINHQFNPRLTVNTAVFLTKGAGYYEEYKAEQAFKEYKMPDFVSGGETFETTDLIRQLHLKNDFYGQIFSVQYKTEKDQLTVGGGWNRFDNHHFGQVMWAGMGIPYKHRWYDLTAYKTDVNGYAKYSRKLSTAFEAFADIQYRRVLYQMNGYRKTPDAVVRETYNFVNPKAGITYTKDDYFSYLSYSMGSKEPNRNDFEANLGQDLKPEKLHDLELGFEKRNNKLSYGATLYYMLYKDQLVLTGNINDVGEYLRANVPDSYRMGIELQARNRFTQWLQASANLTLSNNKIRNYGDEKKTTDIAFSPNVVGGAVITFLPLKDLEISLPAKYVGRQYLTNNSRKENSLEEFYVQDAKVAYTLRKLLFKETTIAFQVNNVFDRMYTPNGYTYSMDDGAGGLAVVNNYFPMAGTNFLVALQIKL